MKIRFLSRVLLVVPLGLAISSVPVFSQGSLLDSEGSAFHSRVSPIAEEFWQRALSKATRTGPNSAIFHNSSVPDLRAAAEGGHPLAQFHLAQLYFAHAIVSGYTVLAMSGAGDAKSAWDQTDAEAIKWLIKSANQGIALSAYNLFESYLNGHGVEKNEKTAEDWLKKAAASGLAKAQYELGIRLANRADYESALKWNRLAAKQHYIRAVTDGYVLEAHKYVHDLGLEELQRLAASGDAAAMRVLSIEQKEGGRFPTNVDAALKCEQEAAELGDPVAAYNLGIEFYKGLGRSKDDDLAFQWMLKSARAGNPDAQFWVAEAYMGMGGYATAKNVAEAVRWHERAVAQGSYISADNLGYMYMNGDGVRRDLVKATRLFDIAARQGDGYGIKNYMDIFGQRHVSYVNGTVVETGY